MGNFVKQLVLAFLTAGGVGLGLLFHVSAQEAPPAEKEKALARVDALEEAVTAKEPDVTTMESVRNWFVKNLPSVAGSVVGLIVHPLVGKLVEVGGDAITTTFRKRFGIEKT